MRYILLIDVSDEKPAQLDVLESLLEGGNAQADDADYLGAIRTLDEAVSRFSSVLTPPMYTRVTRAFLIRAWTYGQLEQPSECLADAKEALRRLTDSKNTAQRSWSGSAPIDAATSGPVSTTIIARTRCLRRLRADAPLQRR